MEAEEKLVQLQGQVDSLTAEAMVHSKEKQELQEAIAAGEAAAREAEIQTEALQQACIDAAARAKAHSEKVQELQAELEVQIGKLCAVLPQ